MPRALSKRLVETRLAANRPSIGISLPTFRRALLGWYDEHRRDLPWRRTRDPYRIWVSEIMLQQTRVAAVLDHYRIFLERFPTVEALAAATEDSVLAIWSGLGYYRRARMMHQCARELVQNHASQLPPTAAALQALPGIGRYTAAAIASIAFAEPIAVVDGNVERVIQRLFGRHLPTPQIWNRAQGLLAASRPGDFNQAIMELGATVCPPVEPQCLVCPVKNWCLTRGELPRTETGKRQQKVEIWCSLECRTRTSKAKRTARESAEQIRLVQRPNNISLMAGMWELPQSRKAPRQLAADAVWRTFRHSITVTNYTVHVVKNTSPVSSKSPNGSWVAIDRLSHIPITGLTRKILKASGII